MKAEPALLIPALDSDIGEGLEGTLTAMLKSQNPIPKIKRQPKGFLPGE